MEGMCELEPVLSMLNSVNLSPSRSLITLNPYTVQLQAMTGRLGVAFRLKWLNIWSGVRCHSQTRRLAYGTATIVAFFATDTTFWRWFYIISIPGNISNPARPSPLTVIFRHEIKHPKLDVDYFRYKRTSRPARMIVGILEHPELADLCCLVCGPSRSRLWALRSILPHMLDKCFVFFPHFVQHRLMDIFIDIKWIHQRLTEIIAASLYLRVGNNISRLRIC